MPDICKKFIQTQQGHDRVGFSLQLSLRFQQIGHGSLSAQVHGHLLYRRNAAFNESAM